VTTLEHTTFRDRELVALLRDDPELLAIADALVATGAHRARRRARGAWLAAGAAAAAAAAVLLLATPWQRGPGLVDKALAAVGDADVLHLVVEYAPDSNEQVVDIASGRPVVRTRREEIWFDGGRDLKRSVGTLDGRVIGETLETREGGWTESGPIYTCAWIAAHPIEATKARVSCNANMENGTTPRTIPEQPPTLDEALAGFVDGYRSALASGQARKIGSGEVDGRAVVWLRITLPPPRSSPLSASSEDVAIDAETSKPVEVRAGTGGPSFSVLVAEAVPYEAESFRKPTPVETQGGGSVSPGEPVTLGQAAEILGRHPLWLGETWNGLRLTGVAHHRPKRAFWLDGHRRVEVGDVIALTYEASNGSELRIYESARCVMNVGGSCGPEAPGEGQALLRPPAPASLRLDGLWVSIWAGAESDAHSQLEVARALHGYAG
jgi:hypothetical protein